MEKNFEMPIFFDHANKLIEAYHVMLSPLCKKIAIPPLALDILLFIANHPHNATAKKVCAVRGLKSGIVSVHIERLEADGYIKRITSESDRRSFILSTTEKAEPIVVEGRKIQRDFAVRLLDGIDKEQLKIWDTIMRTIDENVDKVRKNPINNEVI